MRANRRPNCQDCGVPISYQSRMCWSCSRKRGAIGRPRLPRIVVASKRCSRCSEIRPASDFTAHKKSLDGLQSQCRECQNISHRKVSANSYAAKAAFRRAEKDRPCADCGGRFPPECMDFDHVRGKKAFDIGKSNFTLARLASEIKKCEVVCANCHRIRTKAKQNDGKKMASIGGLR